MTTRADRAYEQGYEGWALTDPAFAADYLEGIGAGRRYRRLLAEKRGASRPNEARELDRKRRQESWRAAYLARMQGGAA